MRGWVEVCVKVKEEWERFRVWVGVVWGIEQRAKVRGGWWRGRFEEGKREGREEDLDG